jgi:predicted ATPase
VIGDAEQNPTALAFGPFELDFAGRRLTEAGRPVAIGSRALDLLIALLERPGELVTKAELIARAWPDTQVEDANLRVQISAIRRSLKDQSGEDYIVAASGRGYRFVAPLGLQAAAPVPREHRLPASLTETIGREADIAGVSERLSRSRLLTIVGPGGIGKTTLSLASARAAESGFADGAIFVEVTEAGGVAMAVAAALGLRFHEEGAIDALAALIAPLELLIVLDSCEYAIEDAARVSEAILRRSPKTTILCASREPLRAEGESVWRIDPLAVPPDDGSISAHEVLDFPAARLFVDRALAADRRFRVTDDDASLVGRICRRLDGLPLAIELAAGRIPALGLADLQSALNDRFQVLLQGRRTSVPRHRSLSAAIDWSYDSLPEVERRALRCFSLFQGLFSSEAAVRVLFGPTADRDMAQEVLTNLVTKSLVIADLGRTPTEYRLLDTTRDYARRKLEAAGELSAAAARHAACVITILREAEAEFERRSAPDRLRYLSRQLQDVRAALDWSCHPKGDASFTVPLTLAAFPVWMRLVRFEEATRRIETALGAAALEPADEMALNIALAQVVLSVPDKVVKAAPASQRAIDLAIRLEDGRSEFIATYALWDAHIADARIDLAAACAVRLWELVCEGPSSPKGIVAERVSAATDFLSGKFASAREAIERVRLASGPRRERRRWRDSDPERATRTALISLLWMEGKPDSAIALARENAILALRTGNDNATPGTLADGACLMAVLVGDDAGAERYLELIDASLRRGGPPGFASWTRIVRALLAARRGDAGPGLAFLSSGFDVRTAHPRRVNLLAELAETLGSAGAGEAAIELADTLLERVKRSGELWILGEIQRVRAQLRADDSEAQALLEFARDTARRQGGVACELRAATNLAARWPSVGKPGLEDILGKYTEGLWTRDVIAARKVLTAA